MARIILLIILFISLLFNEELNNYKIDNSLNKIGDNALPSNPLNDRAKGYLLAGKAKTATQNYGNFIEWTNFPAGLWGEYTYLPRVSFIAGIAGHRYSSDYSWSDNSDELSTIQSNTNNLELLCSQGAYDDWPYYEAIVFDIIDDKGSIGEEVENLEDFDAKNQWWVDEDGGRVCIAMNKYEQIDLEKSSSRIGLAYPWAIRPKFIERLTDYDYYDYGDDREEWTDDDVYEFYGDNTAESWHALTDPRINTNWQATTNSRINSHSTQVSAGDIFGTSPAVALVSTYVSGGDQRKSFGSLAIMFSSRAGGDHKKSFLGFLGNHVWF